MLPRPAKNLSPSIRAACCVFVAAVPWLAAPTGGEVPPAARLPTITTHDNVRAAGARAGSTVRIDLRAARGTWQPAGPGSRLLEVAAFGEAGGPLVAPAPLVRVRADDEVVATVGNELDTPLFVHGLCARDGGACHVLEIPPGSAREVRFTGGTPGTYFYWATTGLPLRLRASADSQLSGAFVVDPPGEAPAPDRVMVLTEWSSLSSAELADVVAQPDPGAAFLGRRPDVLFAINGRSWPHTERLRYQVGERIRWRVVNASTEPHPMHLHGFYFDVERRGDETRDEAFAPDRRPRVVTHLLPPGTTASLTWTAERAGRWLFHCHTMVHVSPTLHVDGSPRQSSPVGAAHGHGEDPGLGMTGLVLGIEIVGDEAGAPGASSVVQPAPDARAMTLWLRSEPDRFGAQPALGFTLAEDPSSDAVSGAIRAPGPILVLRRGEPVEITLRNRLPEATSIHWHGIELDSYYDGVHGWSGSGEQVTPQIDPGASLVVRFTPPRAGTFIYHTHLHDNRQLTSGLYGALVVLEPEEAFDETVDHVFVLGRGGPALDAPLVVNGENAPRTSWTAGRRHRIRLINITPNDTVAVALRTVSGAPVTWRALAKDGAAFAPERAEVEPAELAIAVGETYDFEYAAPAGRQTLWLEIRSHGGKWLAQGRVAVL